MTCRHYLLIPVALAAFSATVAAQDTPVAPPTATPTALAPSEEKPRALDATHFVEVKVADPYLEMRTGPGRGYPVTRVVPRGERVDVLMRRTDWYKVRDDQGKEGWVDREHMELTLLATGDQLKLDDPARRDYERSPWEIGFQTGNFGGGNVNSAYVGYAFNDNLSIETGLSQTLGKSSTSVLGTIGLTHLFAPRWRIAPFVDIGTGVVRISPKTTIVEPANRREQLGYWGLGAKAYVSRRFLFRLDYRSYVIFTQSAQNEDRREWKAGFAFFF
jgi:Bacterial SH3 domain/Outer membrane protein beta-barrel domain